MFDPAVIERWLDSLLIEIMAAILRCVGVTAIRADVVICHMEPPEN